MMQDDRPHARPVPEPSEEDIKAQRRSWVLGELRMRYPALTEEQAGAVVDAALYARDLAGL